MCVFELCCGVVCSDQDGIMAHVFAIGMLHGSGLGGQQRSRVISIASWRSRRRGPRVAGSALDLFPDHVLRPTHRSTNKVGALSILLQLHKYFSESILTINVLISSVSYIIILQEILQHHEVRNEKLSLCFLWYALIFF